MKKNKSKQTEKFPPKKDLNNGFFVFKSKKWLGQNKKVPPPPPHKLGWKRSKFKLMVGKVLS